MPDNHSTIEIWKPVIGLEDRYEVSSLGRVRRSKAGSKTRVGLILRPGLAGHGYPAVSIGIGKHRKTMPVHKLVAAAFHGPKPYGYDTNHINGIPKDNRQENLEYVTRRENVIHSFKIRLQSRKLTPEMVIKIRQSTETYKEIASRFGICKGSIYLIKHRKSWQWID